MTIFNASSGNVNKYTLIAEPVRTFQSSSNGVTGSVYVYARRSRRERTLNSEFSLEHNDSSIDQLTKAFSDAKQRSISSGEQLLSASLLYINNVHSRSISEKNTESLQVNRRVPTVTYTVETGIKAAVKNLGAFARPWNSNATFSYTNYNCLNFITSSYLSTGSVLLYPNLDQDNGIYARGKLTPSGAFSIDFRINPCYVPEINSDHTAGTLLHLSSCFAVSIVTGSRKDENGFVDAYRIMLQLSSSADILPSNVNINTPQNLVFLSSDNSLEKNNWSRVTIRWGSAFSNYSGSININNVEDTIFTIPSASVSPLSSSNQPYVLCVGNFYEGPNAGLSSQAYFFSTDVSNRDGLENLAKDVGGIDEPAVYDFKHPMQGEIHDLAYYNRWLTDQEILNTNNYGISQIPVNCCLYLPPFFTSESPDRKFINDHGGILLTPFQEFDGSTKSPINAELALGVDGHLINLQNFTRDFANNTYPRLFRLTGSAIQTTTVIKKADEFLDNENTRLANLLIMPCDDGNFVPTFALLKNLNQDMFTDESGRHNESQIRLTNLINTGSLLFDYSQISSGSVNDIVMAAIGPSPELPQYATGSAMNSFIRQTLKDAPLTIYQRLRDPDSPRFTFFEFSNLLYGSRISPRSLVITDSNLSGSDNLKITIKDDGNGNLYKANNNGVHATWSSVGHVFYDEGIAVIKSPHLWRFGQSNFSTSWRGQRPIYVMKYDAIAPAQYVNSSSNITYQQLKASSNPSEPNESNVYIQGVLWFDEKLNVIMKSKLAQPVLKREGSTITIRSAIDF